MLNLLFLLGEKRKFSSGEDLLTNILERLSCRFYSIEYCYEETPPSRKINRVVQTIQRRDQLIEQLKDSEIVVVGCGWMAVELLLGIPKIQASRFMGIRHPTSPLLFDAWFTYDPAAALFDPNLYVEILGTVSAAIRYAGGQIKINTQIQPYQWSNL